MIKTKILNKIKGFTLLEMLMTLAIFGIVSGIVIFNYGDFNSEILLSNTAYEVALQVREAQVYSLGVRGEKTTGLDTDFTSRYGVYVPIGDTFVFFNDKNKDGECDGASENASCTACESTGECRNIIKMLRGIKIDGVCVANNQLEPINYETGFCTESNINIVGLTLIFKRPDPDAIITGIKSDGGAYGVEKFKSAGIIVSSNNGHKKAVIIRSTGQISVQNIKNQ